MIFKKIYFFILILIIIFLNSYSKENSNLERANLLLDMLEYRPAIDYYLKSLKENPYQKNVRKNIAYAYFRLGEQTSLLSMSKKAIDFLEKELSLYPENEDAMDLLFFILYKLKKEKEISYYLKKYNIEIEAEIRSINSGLRFFIIGLLFKKKGIFDKAESYFNKALFRGYNPINCYVQLSDIYIIQNRLFECKKILQQAIELYGIQPEFLFIEALRNFKKGNIHFSLKCLIEALNLKPDFKDVLFNLAFLIIILKILKKQRIIL